MVKITLFGLAGTGTSSVGKFLSEKHNLKFNSSGNMFREMAQDNNMSLAEFGIYCENNPSVDKELDSKISKYGQEHENFVFDSRLAWFTIPDSFKVKLECEEDEQIRRIIEREGGDREQVRVKMKSRDITDRKRYKQYYQIEDYMDNSHFDLVIDTTNLSIKEVAEVIEEEVKL